MNADDLSAQLTAHPPEIRRLLETAVTNFVRWDVLAALVEEEGRAPLDLEDLSRYVGREPATLIPELGALVSLGVVARQQEREQTVYRLHEDRRHVVEQFVALCDEPEFRLLVITWVLETAPDEQAYAETQEPGGG